MNKNHFKADSHLHGGPWPGLRLQLCGLLERSGRELWLLLRSRSGAAALSQAAGRFLHSQRLDGTVSTTSLAIGRLLTPHLAQST